MTALQDRVTDLGLTGRDFLTVHDYAPAEVVALLDLAGELKAAQKAGQAHALLTGKAVGMIFTKTSTRTRISFEVGIAQLGAQPLYLNANDIQLRVGETMKDTGNVLSRYLDAIMIRTFAQADVVDLAASATIPIINGLTDDHHPCQAMADALTVKEHCGGLEGRLRLVPHRVVADGLVRPRGQVYLQILKSEYAQDIPRKSQHADQLVGQLLR